MTRLPILRPSLLFLSLAFLSACSHQWVAGPSVSANDYPMVHAKCSIMARHGGNSVSAYGSTRFVAGALIGNAIGNALIAHEDFDDCMEASGFLMADKLPPQTLASATASAPPPSAVPAPASSVGAPEQMPRAQMLSPQAVSSVTQPGTPPPTGDVTYTWKSTD